MLYTMSYQQYKYEHGLTAADQRAADVRAGEIAAELRDLRRSLGRALGLVRRVRPAGGASGAVTGGGTTAPVRILSGVR